MTLWEFAAAVDGWNRVHGGEEQIEPPTHDEFDEMLRARTERLASQGLKGINGKNRS